MKNVRRGKSGKGGYSGPKEEHEQDLNPALTQALTDKTSLVLAVILNFPSTVPWEMTTELPLEHSSEQNWLQHETEVWL